MARVVFVRARLDDVLTDLDGYSRLSTLDAAPEEEVMVSQAGGWVAVRLPDHVHPWQLHNLAYWLLDCGGRATAVIAHSDAGPSHAGYRLERDPEIFDALCGWDDVGNGWTVVVPTNEIVRPAPVPVERRRACPTGFRVWNPVPVRLADPGTALNPTLASTHPSRAAIAGGVLAERW